MTRVTFPVALVVVLVALAGCGGNAVPKDDPGQFAVKVVNLIVANHYAQAWGDLHSADQKVAPLAEYVGCETRSPILARPRRLELLAVADESVGLGNGKFVDSKAVNVRLLFAGGFKVTHTVHVVADRGHWRWILPSWRFRDYSADKCPTDAGSSGAPQTS